MSTIGQVIDGSKFVTMFTDASFCPNTKACGYAVWIKYGSPSNTLKRSGTSIVKDSFSAECMALEEGVKLLKSDVPIKDMIVVIQSDCIGALDKLEVDDLKRVHRAKYVKLKHVKGHQGVMCPRSAVNTWCDREAKSQMRQLRDQLLQEQSQCL